jgi:hypothetical protein
MYVPLEIVYTSIDIVRYLNFKIQILGIAFWGLRKI